MGTNLTLGLGLHQRYVQIKYLNVNRLHVLPASMSEFVLYSSGKRQGIF